MIKDFFDKCKKNDKGLRAALGETRRAVMLGQFGLEEQDFYLLAIDRDFLSKDYLSKTNHNRGFILTVQKDEKNIVFNPYIDFVDDMYSIGQVNLNTDANSLEENQATIVSIEKKINSLDLPQDTQITLKELVSLLSEKEQWFAEYLIKNRWTFNPEHTFDKRELIESVKMYKTIYSLVKEYNLTNASTFGE